MMYDYSLEDYEINPADYERAAQNGVNRHNLRQRVEDYGWEKERAITTPVKTSKKRDEWAALARSNGISYDAFYRRVNVYGWPKKEAATHPIMKARKRKGQSKRKYPQEWIDTAAENGIPERTFIARITQYGWDKERAMTEPVNVKYRKNRKKVESK